MRNASQFAVVAVVAGLGAGWYFYGDRLGLPHPLTLIGLEPVSEANATRPASGGRVQVVAAPVRQAAVVERIESINAE